MEEDNDLLRVMEIVRAITVTLRGTVSGEEREYHTEGNFDAENGGFEDEFLWADGNFACDCNRSAFFDRAAGAPVGLGSAPCGDTRFRVVRIVRDDTGASVYSDGGEGA